MAPFSARDLALHCARLCQDKGGSELRVLSMPQGGGAVCDYVVIVTARSDRQTRAIVDEVYHFCKRHKVHYLPVEGDTGWMLIDCFEVVVHALGAEQREHYALDSLWKNARDVDFEAELKGLVDPDKDRVTKASLRAEVADVEDDAEPVVETEAETEAEATAEAAADVDEEEAIELDAVVAAEAEAAPAPARRRRAAAAKPAKPKKPASKRVVEEAPPAAPRRRGRTRKAAAGKSEEAAGDD
jgi:ribosome-associated protein